MALRLGLRRTQVLTGATAVVICLALNPPSVAAEESPGTAGTTAATETSATAVSSTPFVTFYDEVLQGGGVTSDGVGLARRRGAGAPSTGSITVAGVPPNATVVRSYLLWMTIGADDPVARLDGERVDGTLVGETGDTCWNIGPNRVYRANVTGRVTGNGVHTIGGVATSVNPSVGDGQGASLVVVYAQLGAPHIARVILRNGALSLSDSQSLMRQTFRNLSGRTPQSAALHLGVGDGQPAVPDSPVTVSGRAVSGADLFSGTDGALWDDFTIPVPSGLVAAQTVPTAMRLRNDCLAWGYAGLVEQFDVRARQAQTVN